MKNKIGFIPKSFSIQPDYYKNCFNNWNAVFLTDNDEEYHIELCGNVFNNWETANEVSLLKQNKEFRTPVCMQNFKTIKSAYDHLIKTKILKN